MDKHNNCQRCNAGMPSFRVNPLCEECYAEDCRDDAYEEAFEEEIPGACPHCDGTGWQDCGTVAIECPECNDGEVW